MSQPENEKVYSLGDYVAVRSETNDWFMCVTSEINYLSKQVKVRFMRKSGQYVLLSKKLEKWFTKSAIFHGCSIPSIHNRMCYSFDNIYIKGVCDKIKTYTRQRLQDGPSYLQITAQINVTKRKLLILIKNFNCLQLRFSQTIDLSDRGQLLKKMMYPPPGAWK